MTFLFIDKHRGTSRLARYWIGTYYFSWNKTIFLISSKIIFGIFFLVLSPIFWELMYIARSYKSLLDNLVLIGQKLHWLDLIFQFGQNMCCGQNLRSIKITSFIDFLVSIISYFLLMEGLIWLTSYITARTVNFGSMGPIWLILLVGYPSVSKLLFSCGRSGTAMILVHLPLFELEKLV